MSEPHTIAHVDLSWSVLAERLNAPDGGFTWSTTQHFEPTSGYVVSVYPSMTKVFAPGDVTAQDLYEFAWSRRDLLSVPDYYLGGWNNPGTGEVWLDISTVVETAKEARTRAHTFGQQGYYDLQLGKTINVTSKEFA